MTLPMTLTLDLALAGLGIGSVAALSGLGVIVTYRLTGVFNLAFGAIAMIVTYLFWYEVNRWHWSVLAAAMFDLLVVCPLGGAVIERGIFRPLERRSASPAEQLVASLGLLVVLLGTAVLLWGMQARLDVPSIVGSGQFRLGGHTRLPVATVVDVLVVVGVGGDRPFGRPNSCGTRRPAHRRRPSRVGPGSPHWPGAPIGGGVERQPVRGGAVGGGTGAPTTRPLERTGRYGHHVAPVGTR